MLSDPPRVDDAPTIRALRDALESAEYRLERIRPVLLDASRGVRTDALGWLVRLFFLRLPVAPDEAEVALRPVGLSAAEKLGVVRVVDEDRVIGLVELLPSGGDVFASDGDALNPRPDHVMSPAGSSRLLAHLTPRRPVGTTLDLGTGCGFQAILAARHSECVVATDVTSRALAFTAFNAALNGVSNVECRQADWFSALQRGETFDLVVCNPPYVIAPTNSVYRDNALGNTGASRQLVQRVPEPLSPPDAVLFRDDPSGDGGLSRQLVQRAPELLTPSGVGIVLVGWAHSAEQHWTEPLLDWLDGGCDAWLLQRSSMDPPSYAATWNAHLAADRLRYAEVIHQWTSFFASRGMQRLAEGAIALRRRSQSGAAHVRYDDLPPGDLDDSAANDLMQRMEISSWLERLDDVALAALRPVLANGQRLEQTLRVRDDRFHLEHADLVSDVGLRSRFACQPLLLRLLRAIDGKRTVGEVIESAGVSVDSRAEALALLREAVAHNALRLAPGA